MSLFREEAEKALISLTKKTPKTRAQSYKKIFETNIIQMQLFSFLFQKLQQNIFSFTFAET